jgi:Cu(I)/Ag(I) efflux system membrane fusion protein
MTLVAVTKEEVETGIVTIDAARRQTIGVTVEPVTRRPLTVSVRAVGKVVYDETRLADVTLKLRGWIGKLHVDTLGQRVQRGEPLFTLYSPELYAAQEELLAAAASQKAAQSSTAPERADYLVDAARRRLRLWNIEAAQIDRVLRQGKALEYVPISSPVSGYVIEKNVVEGTAVEPGARLYRLAGLDQVWVEAEVYESDLDLIEQGDSVRITLPYSPGGELQGQVAFVYPYLDDTTRTGRVRIELANPDLALKPDMYANVELEKSLGERLVVPEDAILYAGLRSFVFLDLGEGRLRPKAVELGRKTADFIEVTQGLEEGDRVVTSGNFLVAAESRLKRDMEHWQ